MKPDDERRAPSTYDDKHGEYRRNSTPEPPAAQAAGVDAHAWSPVDDLRLRAALAGSCPESGFPHAHNHCAGCQVYHYVKMIESDNRKARAEVEGLRAQLKRAEASEDEILAGSPIPELEAKIVEQDAEITRLERERDEGGAP